MTSQEETPSMNQTVNVGDVAPATLNTYVSGHTHERQRVLRIRITDVVTGQLKVGMSLPSNLVGVAMRMGARFVPAGHSNDEVLQAFEREDVAAPLVFEDVENGELVEIRVEG
jgi:hypothetical protein